MPADAAALQTAGYMNVVPTQNKWGGAVEVAMVTTDADAADATSRESAILTAADQTTLGLGTTNTVVIMTAIPLAQAQAMEKAVDMTATPGATDGAGSVRYLANVTDAAKADVYFLVK